MNSTVIIGIWNTNTYFVCLAIDHWTARFPLTSTVQFAFYGLQSLLVEPIP